MAENPFTSASRLFDPRRLEEVVERVQRALPADVANLGEDVKRNVQAAIEASLRRMDIVTREEFDIQSAVLARTREQLEQLERRLADLEAGRTEP